jgi:glycyl-tRNA synthetase beta chain
VAKVTGKRQGAQGKRGRRPPAAVPAPRRIRRTQHSALSTQHSPQGRPPGAPGERPGGRGRRGGRGEAEAGELLLEVGVEELPAGFIGPALADLAGAAGQLLGEARVRHGAIRTAGTPRRLALQVAEVAARQADLVREVVGPPRRAAYDAAGNPTRAAIGFAGAQGVPVEALRVKATEKGEYVAALITERGAATRELLPELLPRLITALGFPKTMRWGEGSLRFARPIRWLVALYGGRAVPVELGGLRSGSRSYGHRFLAPRPFEVRSFDQYARELEKRYVLVDPARRKARVEALVAEAARQAGGMAVIEPELLETVTNLVEYPTVVCGSFDRAFLELPRPVLITPMQKHQRYFPVVDAAGRLMPHFIAIANMRARRMDLIRQGNERVLRARLHDARFFYAEDRKVRLADRVEALRRVGFQERLGTMYDKAGRLARLARRLAQAAAPELAAHAERAAQLCKADLTTAMVKEFTELQGTMGGEYASLGGELPGVAKAIAEHYRPRFAGDEPPETRLGALVAVADKLDSLVGYFGLGLIPSGSEDPYALRRQAAGIVLALLKHWFDLSLERMAGEAWEGYGDRLTRPRDETLRDVGEFLKARLQAALVERGVAADAVEAALAAEGRPVVVPDVEARATALAAMRGEEGFDRLVLSVKRIANIVREEVAGAFDPARLQEPAERALWEKARGVGAKAAAAARDGDYRAALAILVGLWPELDQFFAPGTGVLVNHPDPEIRATRHALLREVGRLFTGIADFRKMA